MDIIQKTMAVFGTLVQRIKAIGSVLTYNYLPATTTAEKSQSMFWIFNW